MIWIIQLSLIMCSLYWIVKSLKKKKVLIDCVIDLWQLFPHLSPQIGLSICNSLCQKSPRPEWHQCNRSSHWFLTFLPHCGKNWSNSGGPSLLGACFERAIMLSKHWQHRHWFQNQWFIRAALGLWQQENGLERFKLHEIKASKH